ncbi:MAG: AzlD domain-containing protein [Oenococcus oeni]
MWSGYLVTWFSRLLPFLFLKKFKLATWFIDFLSFVPITIISAILFENLLIEKNGQWPNLNFINCLAAIPTLLAGFLSKSLLIIVIVGVISMALLRWY